MKPIKKRTSMFLVLVLCVTFLVMTVSMPAVARQSTIFGNYDVYLPTSMNAEFHVTTRKPVSSVSISARMEAEKNGVWSTYSTGVYPAFSGTNKTGWDTTADYSSACEKGYKYRLVVTYAVGDVTASYTSNSRTYN